LITTDVLSVGYPVPQHTGLCCNQPWTILGSWAVNPVYVVTKEVYLLLWIENAAPGTNAQPVTELCGCVCDCNKDLYIWILLFRFNQLNWTATEFENWVSSQRTKFWISNFQCGIYKTTLSISMALKFQCLMGEHVIFGFENLSRNEVKCCISWCKCVPWAWMHGEWLNV